MTPPQNGSLGPPLHGPSDFGNALSKELGSFLGTTCYPFAPFIREDFLLMQDNTRPHVAKIVNEYLDTVGI